MFKNLTLGTWSIDFKKKNKYGQLVKSLRVDEVKNSEYSSHKEVVRVYGDDQREQQNAEFICFCFNLQQKYDISLFEEAIKTLEGIKSMCDGNVTKENSIWFECNHILNKLKQNK